MRGASIALLSATMFAGTATLTGCEREPWISSWESKVDIVDITVPKEVKFGQKFEVRARYNSGFVPSEWICDNGPVVIVDHIYRGNRYELSAHRKLSRNLLSTCAKIAIAIPEFDEIGLSLTAQGEGEIIVATKDDKIRHVINVTAADLF